MNPFTPRHLLSSGSIRISLFRFVLATSTVFSFAQPPPAPAAGPAFRLLGARDLGDTNDYRVAQKPPVNHDLLDGELAWRQHDGGHEDRTNMKHFLRWANRLLKHTPPAASPTP